MKTRPSVSIPGGRPQTGRAAFTLVEMMVASGLFMLAAAALLYSHLFGLRLFNVASAKLSASAAARLASSIVRNDVRSAKLLYVGTGDSGHFTNAPDGAARQGNALQIYPTTDTNNYVRYYLDASSQTLSRMRSGNSQIKLIAYHVTNTIPFDLEDFGGNVLTNDVNNRVVSMTLDFYQWEFLITGPRSGLGYDHFRLQTKATRRAIE